MALITEPLREVILYVQNMKREVWFYRDVLGLSIRYPQGLSDYAEEMWGEFETGDCTLALHGGAQDQPQTLHEIVFLVSDVAEARQAIIDAGITIGEVRPLEDGAPIAEGIDPAGHRFAIRAKA